MAKDIIVSTDLSDLRAHRVFLDVSSPIPRTVKRDIEADALGRTMIGGLDTLVTTWKPCARRSAQTRTSVMQLR